jgi:hypothetical protein
MEKKSLSEDQRGVEELTVQWATTGRFDLPRTRPMDVCGSGCGKWQWD